MNYGINAKPLEQCRLLMAELAKVPPERIPQVDRDLSLIVTGMELRMDTVVPLPTQGVRPTA